MRGKLVLPLRVAEDLDEGSFRDTELSYTNNNLYEGDASLQLRVKQRFGESQQSELRGDFPKVFCGSCCNSGSQSWLRPSLKTRTSSERTHEVKEIYKQFLLSFCLFLSSQFEIVLNERG